MKNRKYIYAKITLFTTLLFGMTISCERPLSDEAEYAIYPQIGDIFTDNVVGMGTDFYFPFAGSKATAWSVDDTQGYESSASMRFDIPNANDPEGNYGGAIFRIDGAGRNLTGFDALTFWAKASQGVSIGEFGFGQDFGENKFQVTMANTSLSTNWTKYVIPIPDPSKLIEERGMFWYSAGTQNTNGAGYTFWIDELKFEKLGTVAQPQPTINNSEDSEETTFTGNDINIADRGLFQTFNVSGQNVTVNATPTYFNFMSSNTDVGVVNENGVVKIIGEGTTKITANIGGVQAKGSVQLTSNGALPNSPTPTIPAANVKSIFSDTYTNETESNFTPNFGGSTTQTIIAGAEGSEVLIYSTNNFTGIIFSNTLDASTLTHLHVDIYTQQSDTEVEFQIRDVGANGEIESDNNGNPIGDDKDYRSTVTNLNVNSWNSIDIQLAGDIANQKNNLGAIILVDGPDFILDNIYFYKE